MPELTSNIASPLRGRRVVVAPSSEFVLIASGDDAGAPQATKERIGTEWWGMSGTFGTLTNVSEKRLGDQKERAGNTPGSTRSIMWTKIGFGLEFEAHHDRGLPSLREGDFFSAWVQLGDSGPELKIFHILTVATKAGGDMDTVALSVTAEHRPNFSEITTIIRALCDGMGRTISYTQTKVFSGAGSDPNGGLPTAFS